MKDVSLKNFAASVNFNKLSADEIRAGGSFNVVDGEGKFVGIFVVPASDGKRDQIRIICESMNYAFSGSR